jgi:Fe-S-cluster containining protein
MHLSCSTCSGCCRDWAVVATEEEIVRFKDFDWTATRERFRRREILHPLGNGRYELDHIGEACIFVDDDNLCAIHKEMGMEAKPFMCKHFPYFLTNTPDGVIVPLDVACLMVIANEGELLDQQAEDVHTRIAEWRPVGPTLTGAMGAATLGEEAPRVQARRDVPIEWADHLAFETAARQLLAETSNP